MPTTGLSYASSRIPPLRSGICTTVPGTLVPLTKTLPARRLSWARCEHHQHQRTSQVKKFTVESLKIRHDHLLDRTPPSGARVDEPPRIDELYAELGVEVEDQGGRGIRDHQVHPFFIEPET